MRACLARFSVVLGLTFTATAQGTPYAPLNQQPDRGVPFPLPQQVNAAGRRVVEGGSNSLTISWDGRVLMYFDSGSALWTSNPVGTYDEGFVFTTFNKQFVNASSGEPDFNNCFGTPLPRFATTGLQTQPDTSGTYPEAGKAYPNITGSMGELGLLQPEFLSANLYPAATTVPGGQNPYPGNLNGTYNANGAYRVYDAWVTLQDLTRFWYVITNPSDPWYPGRWWGYGNSSFLSQYEANCTYPNGVVSATNMTLKRNGRCRLRIVVQVGTGVAKDQIAAVNVLEKWKPMTVSGNTVNFNAVSAPPTPGLSVPTASTMWADNFEPNLSMDGHLMVGKGSTLLVQNNLPSRACFYYNPVAFAADGWRGPWQMTAINSMANSVVLDGLTIGERYPIARHPLKDYDGTPLTSTSTFEGGYTWFDPDGRFVIYTCETGGVGTDHPETGVDQDGGGTSNRAHTSIVGSVTGWQMWRIDNAAVNPSRHMFTAWDQDSRTTHLRTSSFGFGPGFWEMLRGAPGLPRRKDGALKLQLVNNNLLRYYELDLSPYQERDYGFYLPMSEMLKLNQPGNVREVDLTRTPDLSGKGHFATVIGGQLPCEYFELPSNTNGPIPGLYYPAGSAAAIHPAWINTDCFITGTAPSQQFWAPLADWVAGKTPDVNGSPTTTAFTGRGLKHDMDSDVCWGRVGQAMFFKQRTAVRVTNPGASAPELHPGTSASGASKALTASLWVRPLQARTATTNLFKHHVRLALQANGVFTAGVTSAQSAEYVVSGGTALVGDWTHVALTWRALDLNTSEMRLYVNGVQVASNTSLPFTQLLLSTGLIQAGCIDTCATTTGAVLLLDEVALKNSALNEPEIGNLALLPIPAQSWTNEGFPAGPTPFQLADERVPAGHAYDSNLANIGSDLFHDVKLSSNGQMSCATCHDPSSAFTDGLPIASGLNGPLLRNTPTLYNLRYATRQFWDARAVDLEDQALDPVFTPAEMGFQGWSDISTYVTTDPGYSAAFAPWLVAHGGGPLTEAHVRQAIATYERLVTAGNAPADQFPLAADVEAGKALFEGKARCSGCHNGSGLGDGLLRVTGTFRRDGHDDGAFATGIDTQGHERFRGAFKTPMLRELTRTAPYFHDGHASTLAEVVDFYDAGGVRADSYPPTNAGGYLLSEAGHDGVAEETNRRLGLTQTEKDQLIAYLQALSAGAAGSSAGPPGWNGTPVVTLVGPSGPPYPLVPVRIGQPPIARLTLDVVDALDGQADLEPGMTWTLQLVVGGIQYNWSSATWSSIPNGWRAIATVPGHLSSGDKVRAADHHGRWSAWVVLP